jgi:hypothetical protein
MEPHIINQVFYGITVGLVGYGVKSIASLNEKMAVILEKVVYHDKLLDRHDFEINKMKENK